MYCVACGAMLSDGQSFCPACGKAVAGASAMGGAQAFAASPSAGFVPVLPRTRVASNVRLLGILWIVYSAIHLLPGLFIIAFFGTAQAWLPPDVPAFVPSIIEAVALVLTLVSCIGFAVGWGLLSWKAWARILAVVLGVLNLFSFPFGTALGIFTLWVLLPNQSEQEYSQLAATARTI